MEANDIKAEEILMLVLEAKKGMLEKNLQPTRVIMHSKYFKKLKMYRATLGDYPEGMEDYLTQDRMFGLDICLDNSYGIQVTV